MNKILLIIITLLVITSCESEEQKINKAKEVVNAFVSNISFDNYETMYSVYPNFQNVATYWKIKDFEISSATIAENQVVTIIGISDNRNILFELQRNNSQYQIINSKGLSSDFDSSIYKYCKKIGCIGLSAYDAEISNICNRKKSEFNQLVTMIKERIEKNTVLENHTVTKNYGFASGDVTVKNNSRFSIPGRAYNLYVNYFDRDENLLFTSKQILNFDEIPYHQSTTVNVFETGSMSFRKIGIALNIVDTGFIEKIISEHAKGSGCLYDNNL